MAKKERFERHTADELRAKQAHGESFSDWAGAAAMSEDEIEAGIAEDADEVGMVVDWAQASRQP